MAESLTFDKTFEKLTGHYPFPWQERLYHDWFARGAVPRSCDLPTGLGKTSVIAVWLIALANGARIPRRLVYVVNRRTVVDQTTAEVERIRDRIETAGISAALRRVFCLDDAEPPLAISTLRGQFADNHEWSADPSRPAVICGTVDMIGSRLLFGGYGIGFKSRPLHAGFLGQDSLLIHDEAHLEPAFQKLLAAIEKEQRRERENSGELPWPTLQVMQLTATTRNAADDEEDQFGLTPEERNLPDKLPGPPTEPIHHVWCRLRAKKILNFHRADGGKDDVTNQIVRLAKTHANSNVSVLIFVRKVDDVEKICDQLTSKKGGVPTDHIQKLTGTIRGLERDALVKSDPVFMRFLPDKSRNPLVRVVEGTVYLVCTSAGEVGVDISADHMVCDLTTFESMVQRFGRVNRFGSRQDTRIDVVYPVEFERNEKLISERQATLRLLEQLNGDASPLALARLNAEQRQAAFAPEPTILPVTDILFDAWALTTIREKMPGRPPVEPYLHGLAEWEPPRTSVAWRREVEYVTDELLKRHGDDFPQTLLDDYPLKPRELLNDTSERVFKALETIAQRPADYPLWIINEHGEVEVSSLARLLREEKKYVIDRISNCTILLPPAAGGLSDGMLNGGSLQADDVADIREPASERRIRRLREGLNELDDPGSLQGMRLVRSIELNPDEEDEAARKIWEWYKLKPLEDTRTAWKPVTLDTHTGDVERHACRIVAGLSLSGEMAQAVLLAAKLHDDGKRRERFQVSLGNRRYPDVLLAKSGGKGIRLPEPFRHELASLAEAVADEQVNALTPPMQDLVLHLIAAHHGRARPHFPADETFDPERPATDTERLAIEALRRFARLQRCYGRWGLAYLESLLRAADWAASAD